MLPALAAAAPSRRALIAGAIAGLAAAPAVATANPLPSESLGLRPSGSDQTAQVTRAIADAARAGRPLYLHPGDYRVSSITMPAGGVLTGPRTARLVGINNGPLVQARGIHSARLVGISLLGQAQSVLVNGEAVPDLVIDDVAMSRGSTLVRLHRCGGQVTRSLLSAGSVGLLSTDATGLNVVGNTLENFANNGIQIWRWAKGWDGSIVAHNRIRQIRSDAGGQGQNGNAVNVFRAGGVSVLDNVMTDCTFSAVRDNAGDAITVDGNKIFRCGEVAIFIEFGFEGAVVSSNLIDTSQNGISCANLDHNGRASVISGNVIRNLLKRPSAAADQVLPRRPRIDDDERGASSYGIFAEAEAMITGNTLENLQDLAIGVGWGPFLRNVSVVGNLIRGCDYGIAPSVVEGVGATLIASNLISGARRGNIVGTRWERYVTGDLALTAVPTQFRNHLMVNGNMASA